MPTKSELLLEQTNAPVSPYVSPGIHPDSLLNHAAALVADDSPATSQAFASARLGLRSLYTALHDFEVADLTMRRNEASGVVVDGRSIRPAISAESSAKLAATMGQRWTGVARVFDQHLNEVADAKAALEAAIAKALDNPRKNEASVAQAASEIRGYVKGLPDSKRMNFLHGAIDAGDHEVVSAVTGASGFVSGLSRDEFATVRDLAENKFAPREYKQRSALSAVHDTLVTAAKNFTARFEKLLPTVTESASERALKAVRGEAA